MGNCCETIDKKIEEILEINQLENSMSSTYCHSRRCSCSESCDLSQSFISEEKTIYVKNLKISKLKLNTIVEDTQEDCVSSPYLLNR